MSGKGNRNSRNGKNKSKSSSSSNESRTFDSVMDVDIENFNVESSLDSLFNSTRNSAAGAAAMQPVLRLRQEMGTLITPPLPISPIRQVIIT